LLDQDQDLIWGVILVKDSKVHPLTTGELLINKKGNIHPHQKNGGDSFSSDFVAKPQGRRF